MSEAKSNGQDASASERQREVRLGLVMYGGVSLAIYINGVAREFFRAVRGSGVYKLVKALTDSDIIVDVISGTSAGGINGIMLAYALCNRKEFAPCANLWRLDGDIRSLLRSPHGDLDSTASLFDSEGYYQPRLEAAFRDMSDYVREEGEIESRFLELDLFITGTDVDGTISTQFDDAGHPIDVKDHRSVFLLKHREGRKEPFNPYFGDGAATSAETTFQALAKLSRITSCFPAAFTPVHVAAETPDDDTVDGKLQLWGDLGKDATFLDGGVIDNKPFTHTIRQIFSRGADREIERKLFYVEPDPEHFERPGFATQPNFVQAIIASLIGIPGYESIADDLKLLASHNSKLKQYQRLRDYLEKHAHGAEPTPRDKELYDRCGMIAISERVIEGVLKENGRARLLSSEARQAASTLIASFDVVQSEMREFLKKLDESQPLPALPGSPDAKPRRRVPGILRNFDVYYRLRRLYRTVYKIAEVLRRKYEQSADPAEINKYANLWRLLNREIEMLEIVQVNMERLIDNAPISWAEEIGRSKDPGQVVEEAKILWAAINDALERLMSLDEDEVLKKLLAAESEYESPAKILSDEFRRVLDEVDEVKGADVSTAKLEGFVSQALSRLNRSLALRARAIMPGIEKFRAELRAKSEAERAEAQLQRVEASQTFEGLLLRTSDFERKTIKALLKRHDNDDPDEKSVRDAYDKFENVDTQLFPIEFIAGLYEKDIIETIRVSPRDAEKGFSKRGLSDKVSGDALYHFGGFFKRSWRSNDILWGRLDSLCQLVETLLDPARIERVLRNPLQAQAARTCFFKNRPDGSNKREWQDGMDPARLFPNAGTETHEELRGWLVKLLWNDDTLNLADREEKIKQGLGAEPFKIKLDRIIEAAQLEILHEELPNVITDALEEQARWNQFRFPRREPKSRRAPKPKGRRKYLIFGRRIDAGRPGAGGSRPEDLDPFVYTPSEGALDPFVSVLAAAGAAHDVMQRFKQKSDGKQDGDKQDGDKKEGDKKDDDKKDDDDAPKNPRLTKLGMFFDNQYKIGSEALLRDMPLLVLLEILSVSLLVLRNCVLKIFGSNAERIKAQPLYVFLVDFPLRAFNTLVLFMRRVPSTKKRLPQVLFILALVLLIIGVVWRDSIIWVTRYNAQGNPVGEAEFYLSWFIVFLAAPLAVLFAQGVYLYQGEVNEGSWLRSVRNALIGLFLLLPALFVVLAFAALHKAAREGLAEWGKSIPEWMPFEWGKRLAGWMPWDTFAGLAVTAALLLIFFGPLLTPWLLSRLTRKGRPTADELRYRLQRYFSLQEMLVIARRLQLFDLKDLKALAKKMGLSGGANGDGMTYEELSAQLRKKEKEKKQPAYDKLRDQLKAALVKQGEKALAVELDSAASVRAANEFYQEMKDVEVAKMRIAEEYLENSKRSDKATAVEAGRAVAESIVSKAKEEDRAEREKARKDGKKPKNEKDTKLAQLEELMYSINPEAMR